MGARPTVAQIVGVSIVLAVAGLEVAYALSALGGAASPAAPTASVSSTTVGGATDASSPAQSAEASPAGATGPTKAEESTAPTGTAQPGRTTRSSASTAVPATGSVVARQDLAAEVAAAANAEREAAGIKPLTYTSCPVPATWAVHLATAATLTHNSLTTILSTCGGKTTAGENIAVAYTTPADVTAGWMSSTNHQANILNPAFTKISVGVAQAADGTFYWVEDFTD